MKQFKSFDKVLYRSNKYFCWIPSFYQLNTGNKHFLIDVEESVSDENIIPYEGNEHLAGIAGEPEEEIILEKGELIICSLFDYLLKKGKGSVCNYSHITQSSIHTTECSSFSHCIPMSKYNVNNLEETSKWILTIKNGKLVKVNK